MRVGLVEMTERMQERVPARTLVPEMVALEVDSSVLAAAVAMVRAPGQPQQQRTVTKRSRPQLQASKRVRSLTYLLGWLMLCPQPTRST